MRVIFLDVDGVINSGNNMSRNARLKRTCENMYFDPTCMNRLKKLVENTGAKIVLSSTWRLPDERTRSMAHLENLKERLALYGLCILDSTPALTSDRNQEVNEWLQSHPEVVQYIILDDVNDNFQGDNLRRLVLTDEIVGLTDQDAAKAERLLKE